MNTFEFRADGDVAKPVLLLANSLGADTGMWDGQVAAWQGYFRVFRFDYAGHGAYAVPPDCQDTGRLAAFLLGELDRRGVDTFRLVGLSLGGMLGMQLAAQAPTRVVRLVLANCRYFQEAPGRAMWDQRIAAVRELGLSPIVDATLERWFTEAFRSAHPDKLERLAHTIRAVSADGYASAAAMVRDFDARPLLGAIAARTLVIGGAQDGAAPAPHLACLAELLHAGHLTFDPCAHLSNIECEGRFTAEVSRFLA